MTSYQKGHRDGIDGNRKDCSRVFENEKAEKAYWNGYIDGMKQANKGMYIVKCSREGKIFATDMPKDCRCPSCGRHYINGESDQNQKLVTIAFA